MNCPRTPCSTCPYRKDTPKGIWHESEYQKLAEYDEYDHLTRTGPLEPATALFLCHQSHVTGEDTVCRGWVATHPDSVAVRLAMLRGELTPEQVYEEQCPVELYASGREAMEAGLSELEQPSTQALKACGKLLARGRGRIIII